MTSYIKQTNMRMTKRRTQKARMLKVHLRSGKMRGSGSWRREAQSRTADLSAAASGILARVVLIQCFRSTKQCSPDVERHGPAEVVSPVYKGDTVIIHISTIYTIYMIYRYLLACSLYRDLLVSTQLPVVVVVEQVVLSLARLHDTEILHRKENLKCSTFLK